MQIHNFMPREHGTWAMWIVPMLSAVLATHFSLSFAILFICFTLFFISHRPILSLAKSDLGPSVLIFLVIIYLPAVAMAIALIVLFKLPWLILFWIAEFLLFAFSVKIFEDREQRAFINELIVLFALTFTCPAAYYTITGTIDTNAAQLFLLNFLFFGSSVFYVKARLDFLRSKGKWTGDAVRTRNLVILYHLFLVVAIILLSLFGHINIFLLLGFLPMITQVAIGLFSRKTKIDFVRVGIALVFQSAIFLFAVWLFWIK